MSNTQYRSRNILRRFHMMPCPTQHTLSFPQHTVSLTQDATFFTTYYVVAYNYYYRQYYYPHCMFKEKARVNGLLIIMFEL